MDTTGKLECSYFITQSLRGNFRMTSRSLLGRSASRVSNTLDKAALQWNIHFEQVLLRRYTECSMLNAQCSMLNTFFEVTYAKTGTLAGKASLGKGKVFGHDFQNRLSSLMSFFSRLAW
jgi:hypothetical protein